MEIPEGINREKDSEEIFEVIMVEYFSKLMKDTNPQIQESWRLQKGKFSKKFTPNYAIFKLHKTKNRGNVLKEPKKNDNLPNKNKNYMHPLIRNHMTRRQFREIVNVLG